MTEHAEFRRQFFAEVRRDPFTHMVTHMWTQAWADGYEQALRDHGLDDERFSKSYRDRCREAAERLADAGREAEAQMLVALGQLGENASRTGPDAS